MTTFRLSVQVGQGNFRDRSPTISDAARRPMDDKGSRHSHLLALGYEHENLFPAIRGAQEVQREFADREIRWWRSRRSGDDSSVNGPTRNMASSQIACINALFPLRQHPRLLLAVARAIDPTITELIPLAYWGGGAGHLSSLVEFEWVGLHEPLEGGRPIRGALVTSADALLVGLTAERRRRALLIEWKYTEDYTRALFMGRGRAGDTRRRRYERLYRSTQSAFSGTVPFNDLLYEPFYQVVRLGLLGDAMIARGEFGVDEATVAVVCPPNNEAYRKTITSPPLAERFADRDGIAEVCKALWRQPSRFVMTSPEALLTAVRRAGVPSDLDEWSDYMSSRYGW